ncbi:MAG: hypothetical protein JW801_00285 [Bacteroidales bacterium]|nr:hypothetical protein [Bacteroidales bacterium]
MKNLIFILLFLFARIALFAQDEYTGGETDREFETVFHREKGDLFISGFGGPQMAFSAIGDNFAHYMGGGGGVIVNNFFFGGYGVGLTTPVVYKNSASTSDIPGIRYNIEFGHGGLWTGFILARKRPVHLSVSTQFGWGEISQVEYSYDYDPISSESVFVLTPIIELEMNLSHFFKVGIGGSTSLVSGNGIIQTPYEVSDFLKPSVYLTFKFGWFN